MLKGVIEGLTIDGFLNLTAAIFESAKDDYVEAILKKDENEKRKIENWLKTTPWIDVIPGADKEGIYDGFIEDANRKARERRKNGGGK